MEANVTTLRDAKPYQWYEVAGLNGIITPGECIQYIEFNQKTKRYFVIGESSFDEIGYYVHEDDAARIKLRLLVF